MILKNGEIIAIGKVLHDETLIGDGTSASPLVVNGNILKNAGDWLIVTGKYPDFTYSKKEGNMAFENGAVLSANSVYEVTTDICFTPSAAKASWYDMSINIGNQKYNFVVDGANAGPQTYSFTQIENVGTAANKTLKIIPQFDSIGNATIVQSIHNIISLGNGGSSPTPIPTETIEMTLQDLDTSAVNTYNVVVNDGTYPTDTMEMTLQDLDTSAVNTYNVVVNN